jgi:3-(3-hydroxy-phenyl)propionate hydroxylase
VLSPDLQASEGSRAIVFTRRTLEILQQVGVSNAVLREGLGWNVGKSYFRGQEVFRMQAPHDHHDRFAPMTNLQQQILEEILIAACEAQPLIELRFGNKVVGIEPRANNVTLQVDTTQGPYDLDTDWVVAADGGRSYVRSALGLKMEGAAYEGLFVIADIRIDLPYPTERLAYFDPSWNRGNTILMHREPRGIWRIDYQLPVGESPEQALRPESLRQRINAQLAMIGFAGAQWTMDWSSVYSAKTLTLPSYVHGRVVFAGDAAHLLPIFGVRGANTAFQDAQSLGWHLAFVVKGLAGPHLLQNYSEERVGAAREIIEEAGKSTRFMAPPSRGFRLLRDAVLSLSLQHEFVRPLYHWRTSRPHAYLRSSLNSAFGDGSLEPGSPLGAPPKNFRIGSDAYLLDVLGGGFDLLWVTDGQPLPAKVIESLDFFRDQGVAIKVLALGTDSGVVGAARSIPDASGEIREHYGLRAAGSACLLRPDQHLCARWTRCDASSLRQAITKICRRLETLS